MKADIVKAVVDTPLEDEAAVQEVLKASGLAGEPAELALGIVRVIKGFEETLPEQFLTAVAKASGCKLEAGEGGKEGKKKKEKAKEDEEYGYPPVKKGEEDPILKGLDLSKVPAEMRPQLEMLWKSARENREQVAKMLDEKEQAEFVLVAKSFEAVPVAVDELAATLRAIHKACPEQYEKILPVMKALDSSAAQRIYTEYGRSGTLAPSSAEAKVEQLASSLVAKDSSMTYEKAYAQVLRTNQVLAKQLEDEYKAQRSKGAA